MNLVNKVKRLAYEIRELKRLKSDLALGSMRLSAPDDTQDFSDFDYSVVMFDEIVENRGNLKVNLDDNSITVEDTGLYSIEIGFCAGFPGSEELNLMTLVNDLPYSSEASAIQGRNNNKPVSLYWKSTARLRKGQKIQLGAMNGDTGSVTPHIKRLHFEVKRVG